MSRYKNIESIVFDWNEPGRVVKVDIIQDRAAQLGITSEVIAGMLNGIVGGSSSTEIRDKIYLVNVVGRAMDSERTAIETLQNLQLATKNGSEVAVPSSPIRRLVRDIRHEENNIALRESESLRSLRD